MEWVGRYPPMGAEDGHRPSEPSDVNLDPNHSKSRAGELMTESPSHFLCCTHDMWTFPGQGSNPRHSSDLSHGSDDTGPLTRRAVESLPDFNSWRLLPDNLFLIL